jgi:hypothetical protein
MMNTNFKKIILLALVLGLLGAGVGTYLWFKPVAKISSMTTDLTIPANELFIAYEANEEAANSQYLNKVIEVTGIIREVKENEDGLPTVIFETDDLIFGVMCEFESKAGAAGIQVGDLLTIKGICTGKLLDVVLNRSELIN